MLNAINQQTQRNIAQPRRGVTTIEVGGPCRLGGIYKFDFEDWWLERPFSRQLKN